MPVSEPHSSLICADSRMLREAAGQLRHEPTAPRRLKNGVKVTAEQLEAAAALLAEAPKSQITSVRGGGGTVDLSPQELGGYIHAERQNDPAVLVFDVGILTGLSYRIARDGTVAADGEG